MSLNIFRDPFLTMSPMEQFLRRFYEDPSRRFEGPFAMRPYWFDQPMNEQCNIGNTVGTAINDKDKFLVEINVSQFSPEELSVNLKEKDLIVEGHHEERNDEFGSIERHFVRKYRLPDDVHLENVQSNLSKDGVLKITAPKKVLDSGRNIPIMPAAKETEQKK